MQLTAKKQAGFTLVEVIVVIALIGIVIAISYPLLGSFTSDYSFRAAGREVMTTVMQARSNSVRDNSSWQVTRDSATDFTLVDPNGTGSQTHSLSGGATLIPVGANQDCGNTVNKTQAASIGFTGRGFATAGASIYLENARGDRCYEIQVTAGGAVKMDNL